MTSARVLELAACCFSSKFRLFNVNSAATFKFHALIDVAHFDPHEKQMLACAALRSAAISVQSSFVVLFLVVAPDSAGVEVATGHLL